MLSQIAARADGEIGLVSLGVGFLLQGGGYVCLIAGAKVSTGAVRALLSVGLAALAFGAAWLVARRRHEKRVLHLAVAPGQAKLGIACREWPSPLATSSGSTAAAMAKPRRTTA